MKHSLVILAAAGMLFLACNKKSESGQAGAPAARAEIISPKPAFAASDSFKADIGKVYAGYLNVEGALAHDDFQKAKEALQAMPGQLQAIPSKGLDTAGAMYWDTLYTKM